jgi:hypothetical protein
MAQMDAEKRMRDDGDNVWCDGLDGWKGKENNKKKSDSTLFYCIAHRTTQCEIAKKTRLFVCAVGREERQSHCVIINN